MRTSRPGLCFLLAAVLTAPSALPVSVAAQDRLKEMPGYAHYRQMSPRLTGAIRSGALAVEWSADGSTFTYWLDGKRFR